MAIINYTQVRNNVHRQAVNSVRNFANNSASQKFVSAKKELLKDFEEHEVTREIEAGEGSENLSDNLSGKGNLWGFIGFLEGSSPIGDLREELQEIVDIDLNNPKIKSDGPRLNFVYDVSYPSFEELKKKTKMEWESRSWLEALETFISGLPSYIYWKARGRSGAGIQAKDRAKNPQKLRSVEYQTTPYLSVILDNFRQRFIK